MKKWASTKEIRQTQLSDSVIPNRKKSLAHSLTERMNDHKTSGTTERIAINVGEKFLLDPRLSLRNGIDRFNRVSGSDPIKSLFVKF